MVSRALIIGPAHYRDHPQYPGDKEKKLEDHEEIACSASLYGEILAADDRWEPDQIEVLPEHQLNSINDVMEGVKRAANGSSGGTLLVVYVGHGMYWPDLPAAQVHFAVGSSLPDEPSTWLSSWYVYRAMRKCEAARKILIADCCYSGHLREALGPENGTLYIALGEVFEGTCVLTAVKDVAGATAKGCKVTGDTELEEPFKKCTTFSGHLLSVLSRGTTDAEDELTVGMIYDAIRTEMEAHGHHRPGIILNDAPRGQIPMFSNKKKRSDRGPAVRPVSPEEWVGFLLKKRGGQLEPLLADPAKAGEVVSRLYLHPDESGRPVALRVNRRADEEYRGRPDEFARYWVKAAPAVAG